MSSEEHRCTFNQRLLVSSQLWRFAHEDALSQLGMYSTTWGGAVYCHTGWAVELVYTETYSYRIAVFSTMNLTSRMP